MNFVQPIRDKNKISENYLLFSFNTNIHAKYVESIVVLLIFVKLC